ncbi:MAG: (2Fe-2S)-binding protein [Cyanobacteria bacterium P01_C01_bin.89]
MYVCICHAVTDRDVKAAAAQGISCMSGLCQSLKVGSQCGRCAKFAQETLDKALEKAPVAPGKKA